MECERNDSDDEELEALRLAALATLKSRAANKLKDECSETSTRTSSSPAPLPRKEAGPASLTPNQYSWRNSAPPSRRGRGRGGFPKVNQRSNLIVITPVSTDNADAPENSSKPQLSLPQHKWCQAVNENSSSPKTFSRRGPTRFNRHESGSESSDSDYDDASDQDSYSNETILQDENSINFAQLTPEESVENDSTLRNADHRLSFQNAHLEGIQSVECVPGTKSTYSLGGIEDKVRPSSTMIDSINRDSTNYSSYQEYNPSPGMPYQSQLVSSVPVNNGSRIDRDYEDACRRISDAAPDAYSGRGIQSCSVDPNLSQNDLRLELKKRMLKLRSETADLAKSETQSADKHVRDERRTSDDFGRGYSRDSGRIQNRSRSDATDRDSRDRSRSLTRNRNRLRSPSSRSPDRIRSRSRDRDHKHGERTSKRDYSHSPGRRHNRESTPSPDRNGKHSWSRSPVKIQRRTSASPIRNNKRNYSRSPVRSRKRSRSPQRSVKHNYSRSPERSNKREKSRSLERSNKRKYSRSPERINKHDSRSPERKTKRYYSESPERSTNRDHSSDKSKKPDFSHCPNKSHQHNLSPSSKNCKSSHSPYKSHKRSRTPSPDRTSRLDVAPIKSQKHSGTQSPVRNEKRNSIPSPDKTRRKSSPQSLERKHKRNISRSPHRSEKSRSPEKKPPRFKRDRSRSPVRSHRHDSSESLERNRGRRKSSRFGRSRSSSALSSSSGSDSSGSGRNPHVRSISSVVKPVQSCAVAVVASSKDKRGSSSDSDFAADLKKRKDLDDKPKVLSSLVKSSIVVGENRNNAPDGGKRLPVHMRLGTLPRNKLIRMTKDVEAAFVNTSSDENAETEGKKQNFRIVANSDNRRVQKSPSKNAGDSKSRRKKTYR